MLLRAGQNAKIKGDAAIAMISAGTLGTGYLIMNLFSKSSNLAGDVCSALVIFPALSAMRVFKTFRSVTICSVILSVTCAALGILVSIVAGTPVGATIVAADIAGFALFCAAGALIREKV